MKNDGEYIEIGLHFSDYLLVLKEKLVLDLRT
ncbi:hypothetical protein AAKU61_002090 [Undibacterium sp. GrIS 1.2]